MACNVVLLKGRNGAPDATTMMYFTPVYQDSKWHLILTDSRHGETTITQEGQKNPEKIYERRDSLKDVYENSDAAKNKK